MIGRVDEGVDKWMDYWKSLDGQGTDTTNKRKHTVRTAGFERGSGTVRNLLQVLSCLDITVVTDAILMRISAM